MGSVLSVCCTLSSNKNQSNPVLTQTHQSSTSYSSSAVVAQTYQSSSSTSSSDRWSYDVFLNFRGEDTRKNFVDHLYTALDRVGIRTFRDDEELERGKAIHPSLLQAIEESRISIPVFSKNYAFSKWCLEELAKMVECRDRTGQILLPIFFDVDPSEVRNQTGSYSTAFQQHSKRFEREKVERWRKALGEAGTLSGWNLKEVANGHESKLIHLVVKKVLSELNSTPVDVAKHPVGIDSHVETMMGLLQVESEDVLFVGICGMGGIGKTTIAKAVLNRICGAFQCVSFLADIQEVSLRKGLAFLQKQLLDDILYEENEGINDVSRGKRVIKERLCSKKVLIILDDVNQNDQLDALAGKPNWFGSGSRVIITTRDEHVLNVQQVDSFYKPEALDFHQSLLLFSKHTFGKDQPPQDYRELSKKMVRNVGGLPLALEVLGSFLIDKKTLVEWESTLDKLKKIPLNEVQARLKISYEGLDDFEKDIFLDIACFFIGVDKEIAISIWDSCGFSSRIGITVLIHKSLIKIGNNNDLRMHDQIRDMGREVVRQENLREPGMRSRLWLHEEALGVLKQQTGTINIEGLHMNFGDEECDSKKDVLSTKAFALMPKLRLLRVNHAYLEGDFEHLPKDLRSLTWQGCPLEYIPTTFHLHELVVLDLSKSKVTQVWNPLHQNKALKKLKVLDLRDCYSLTRMPDLSGLSCLERLILNGCINLVEVDESIGHLKRLVFLDLGCCVKLIELPDSIGHLKNLARFSLQGCRSLSKIPDSTRTLESLIELILAETDIKDVPDLHGTQNRIEILNTKGCKLLSRLPDSVGNLRNLKSLHIDCTSITKLPDSVGLLEKLEELTASGCKKLVKLPNSMGKMRSLKYLDIAETGIAELPEDFGMLSTLKKLKMTQCREFKGLFPVSFFGLHSLEEMHASNCNLSDGGVPNVFGRLSGLTELILEGNNFYSLPISIITLCRLQTLDIKNCSNLYFLPKLPSSLTFLYAGYCSSMVGVTNMSNLKRLKILTLQNCEQLANIQGLEGLEGLLYLSMSGCKSIERLPDLSNLKKLKILRLRNCENLAEIQALEGLEALEELSMSECTSVERLPGLTSLKKLKTLWLRNCRKLTQIQGLQSLESLEVLEMGGCTSVETLPDFSNLRKLTSLWLKNCENLSEIRGLKSLESLEELDMDGCKSIERLPGLLELRKIKTLRLTNCENLAEGSKLRYCENLADIRCLESLEALEELHITWCMSIETLLGLSNLKMLKRLTLGHCQNLAKISGLESLEALERLVIDGCSSIERLPGLLNLKKLKRLKLKYCGKLADIPVLEGLEALEELNITACTSIERLLGLSSLKKLKKLILKHCEKLAEIPDLECLEALEKLVMLKCSSIKRLSGLSNLKKLKGLTLKYCGMLTDIQVLEPLEVLEELNVSWCRSIQRLLGLSNLKRLKRLNLSNCEKLAEIRGLESLEALEDLDLEGCTSIESLIGLSNLKKLKRLWLTNCEKLADIQVLEGFEALEELDFRGCTSKERLPFLPNLKESKTIISQGLFMDGYSSSLVTTWGKSLVLEASSEAAMKKIRNDVSLHSNQYEDSVESL